MAATPSYRLPDFSRPVSNIGKDGKKMKQVRFVNEAGLTYETKTHTSPSGQTWEYSTETPTLCNALSVEAADRIVAMWNAGLE